MQRFALKQDEKKPRFNQLGYYWTFLPLLGRFPVRQGDSHFFCSEYVTHVLHQAGFLDWANPATTDPNTLFVYLKKLEQGVISFNTKLERALAEKGSCRRSRKAPNRSWGLENGKSRGSLVHQTLHGSDLYHGK